MNKEKALSVIKEYLSRVSEGSLIVDTQDGTLNWSADGNEISHGVYVVIESYNANATCDCGDSYSEDCEQCTDAAYHLLEKVESVLAN